MHRLSSSALRTNAHGPRHLATLLRAKTSHPPPPTPAATPSVINVNGRWPAAFEARYPAMAMATRIRKSPYYDRTQQHGCQQYTVYNHMIMPLFYDLEKEYKALTEDVAIWDVGAERQVQLEGPDAEKLANYLTCRNIEGMVVGECKYAIMCNDKGHVINDPVLLKVAENKYWFSIADSDVKLWAQAFATAMGMDVSVSEPDVSPLALQGPKSVPLLKDLFGDQLDVDKLKHFWFQEVSLDGIPMLVARSGWSPERGYELYMMDRKQGTKLWDKCWQAGKKYNIFPGAPNQERRIEGGMISFAGDTLPTTNALELGLPKRMVDLDGPSDFVGKAALLKVRADGAENKCVGLRIYGDGVEQAHKTPYYMGTRLKMYSSDGALAGKLSAISPSRRISEGDYLGLGSVRTELSKPGTELCLHLGDGTKVVAVVEKMGGRVRDPILR